MIAERLLRLFEPGEDAAIALVKNAIGRSDVQPGDDLVDQLALAARRQGGDDFLVVEHARGDERLLAAIAVRRAAR